MNEIIIIDYGYGNIYSIKSAIKFLGFDAIVSNKIEEIIDAQILILPGVGSFSQAMQSLKKLKLDTAIKEAVNKGIGLIGICLGYQMLFESSSEFTKTKGLGLLKGNVINIDKYSSEYSRIPNIGWRPLKVIRPDSILDFQDADMVYFVHSYIPQVKDKKFVLASINYGSELIDVAVRNKNIIGFQFHPEKSAKIGLKILKSSLVGLINEKVKY